MNNPFYEEKLTCTGFIVILGASTLLMIYLLVLQVVGVSIGGDPDPIWIQVVTTLLLLGATVNSWRLVIRITSQAMTVRLGVFHETVPLDKIMGCARDTVSWIRYGGFGVRRAIIYNKRRRIYNTIGVPRVVISLRGYKFHEIAFSTQEPERICAVVAQILADRR